MGSAATLADIAASYWFAGILTLVAALIVMAVMLAESRKDRSP